MEIGQILNELKNDPIYIEAVSNGVDVEKVVLEHIDKWKRFTLKTAIAFAKSELTKKIQSKNDTALTGITVGQYDKYDMKLPVTFPLLSSDGNHTRLVSFDSNKIPEPSRVELKVRLNGNYNNYMITDIIKIEPIGDRNKIIEKLMRVAVNVGDLDFSKLQRNDVKVVRGVINWVNPASKWKDHVRDGSFDVFLSTEDTEKRFVPVIDVTLQKNGNNSVVVQLVRQRFGKPVYEITDLNELCQAAVAETQDPIEQAKIVKAGLSGRNVVAIGEVSSLKEGEKGNYINLTCYAIFEYDSSFLDGTGTGNAQTQIVQTPSAQTVKEPVAPPVQEKPAHVDTGVVMQLGKTAQEQSKPENLIEQLGKQIKHLSNSFGRGAGSFGIDELRKMLKVTPDVPDIIIEEAKKWAVLPKE